MYNRRIENFNKLLYLDACTHYCAYLFDSNYYLSYDYNMFWKKSGSVNNRGMANIFVNINLMLQEFIEDELMSFLEENNCNSSNPSVKYTKDQEDNQFFLQ